MEKVLGEQKSSWLATTTTSREKKLKMPSFFGCRRRRNYEEAAPFQHSNFKEIAS